MADILTQEEIDELLDSLYPNEPTLNAIKDELIYLFNRIGTYDFQRRSKEDQLTELRKKLDEIITDIGKIKNNEIEKFKNTFIDALKIFVDYPQDSFKINTCQGDLEVKEIFINDFLLLEGKYQDKTYQIFIDKNAFINIYHNSTQILLKFDPNMIVQENIKNIKKYNQEFFSGLIDSKFFNFSKIEYFKNWEDLNNSNNSKNQYKQLQLTFNCFEKNDSNWKSWGIVGVNIF